MLFRSLRSIYDHESYAAVLPPAAASTRGIALRRHQRFSIRCPARLEVASYGERLSFPLQVIELSLHGFKAECGVPLPEGTRGRVEIDLGEHEAASVEATAVRRQEAGGVVCYGFLVPDPDLAWRRCVAALNAGRTHADLAPSPPAARPATAPAMAAAD